jgi:hypothetical protein
VEPYLNGVRQATSKVPDKPRSIFPGAMFKRESEIVEPTYSQLLDGTTTLEMVVRVAYKGPANRPYSYPEKFRYDPRTGASLNLGPPDE